MQQAETEMERERERIRPLIIAGGEWMYIQPAPGVWKEPNRTPVFTPSSSGLLEEQCLKGQN